MLSGAMKECSDKPEIAGMREKELEQEIDRLKGRLNAVVAHHGMQHRDVDRIMIRLDYLIARIMKIRFQTWRTVKN